MPEHQDAKEAIKTLNNYEIRPGRFLVVTKSVDNRRLWVSGSGSLLKSLITIFLNHP